ncbi:hypothetical protein OIU34_22265 [Pararhizobium sp. BT-229]|uniref:hypothetical protein n=1 Tax=Pararhizobium sp. BT-229 TaxID=2986923 RepID=UPI0021F7CD91|nr:hypothetical protein [Pararhizobium sp. BT-229]MCV9964619.1 hypothetical protein [Pararhizobium sp. BT-229]
MIIEVPIRYNASGRKKGNSINSTLPFQEMIEVDIPVVGDEEAPVVAEWDDTPPVGTSPRSSGWTVRPGEEREHVRLFDDAYWRPLRNHEISGTEDGHPISAGEFTRIVGEGRHRSVFPVFELTGRKFFPPERYFETVDFSARRKHAPLVQRAAADLLIVDGVVYGRCIEPMILVSMATFDLEWRPGTVMGYTGYVMRIVNRPQDDYWFTRAESYPMHSFREALGKARRLNATHTRVKDDVNEFNLKKQPVLSGDYFLRPENAPISDCGIKLRQFLAVIERDRETMLPLSDTAKLKLYCGLREALDDMPSDRAMDTVETLGHEYIARYEEDREHNHPEQIFLKKAMKAASERPVELMIASGLPVPRI